MRATRTNAARTQRHLHQRSAGLNHTSPNLSASLRSRSSDATGAVHSPPITMTALLCLSLLGACVAGDVQEDAASSSDGEGPDLAVVQGGDDRVLIAASNSVRYPWRAVAAFRPSSQRSTASCTAFKVGPRHALTAAHCFESSDGAYGYVINATPRIARLVFGQYGSGDLQENMPVDGAKIGIESVYIPPEWKDSRGTDRQYDWALMRLADADSSRGWFNALARRDDEVRSLDALFIDGFPLDTVTGDSTGTDSECAASPLSTKDCGGYQYQATATISAMNSTYLEVARDWDRGQSGGPIYAEIPTQSQRVAVALVSLNKAGRNVARRIDSTISDKICEQVRMFPSARFPTHECGR